MGTRGDTVPGAVLHRHSVHVTTYELRPSAPFTEVEAEALSMFPGLPCTSV